MPRHPLGVVGVVTGSVGTELGPGGSSGRNAVRVLDDPGGEIDVGGLVIDLDPGLIELVTETDVDGQFIGGFPIVLNVAGGTPLTVADEADGGSQLRGGDAVEDEVSRPVTGSAGQAGEVAGVVEFTQEAVVGGVEVVLLVTGGLDTDGEQMVAALPGEIVVVIEGIVAQNLDTCAGSEEGGVVAKALSGESGVRLVAEGNADEGVAVESEGS